MNINEEVTTKTRFNINRTSDVIVIDDDESMCEGCRQTLEEEGYRAIIARDGFQGLKLVEESHPKIAIVDLKMPGMTGIEVLAKISEIDSSIVSIAITGYSSIYSEVEVKKIGVFDFLKKPFEPEHIIESVKRGMKLRQLYRETEAVGKADSPTEMPESGTLKEQDIIIELLERASYENQFITQLTDQGSGSLEDYNLSSEEKAALISGDLRWIENHIGKLTETQKTWFNCRLQQEIW